MLPLILLITRRCTVSWNAPSRSIQTSNANLASESAWRWVTLAQGAEPGPDLKAAIDKDPVTVQTLNGLVRMYWEGFAASDERERIEWIAAVYAMQVLVERAGRVRVRHGIGKRARPSSPWPNDPSRRPGCSRNSRRFVPRARRRHDQCCDHQSQAEKAARHRGGLGYRACSSWPLPLPLPAQVLDPIGRERGLQPARAGPGELHACLRRRMPAQVVEERVHLAPPDLGY